MGAVEASHDWGSDGRCKACGIRASEKAEQLPCPQLAGLDEEPLDMWLKAIRRAAGY